MSDAEIRTYIGKHRDALRRDFLASGHSPAEADFWLDAAGMSESEVEKLPYRTRFIVRQYRALLASGTAKSAREREQSFKRTGLMPATRLAMKAISAGRKTAARGTAAKSEEARFKAWLKDFDARHAAMRIRLDALLLTLGVDPNGAGEGQAARCDV